MLDMQIDRVRKEHYPVDGETAVFATAFSTNFETRCKLETGRKFLRVSGSSDGFLSRGVTWANFGWMGNTPVPREVFTILVKAGRRVSAWFSNREVGTGSSEQDLAGDFLVNFRTSDSERGINCTKSEIVSFGGMVKVMLTERSSQVFANIYNLFIEVHVETACKLFS